MYLDVAISERMVGVEDFHNEHFVIISSNVEISMTNWRKYLEKNWEKVTELLKIKRFAPLVRLTVMVMVKKGLGHRL